MNVLKRVLSLFFVFAFTVVSGATSAQAAGGAVGWLPMLPANLSGAPVQVQARNQFHAMLPQLLQARRRGLITAFTPDFNDGVLMVNYAAGSPPVAVAGNTAFSSFDEVMQANHVSALAPRNPAASTAVNPHLASSANSRVLVNLFSDYYDVYARDAGNADIPSAVIKVKLKDASGNLLSASGGTADGTGFFYGYFSASPTIHSDISPGMILEVSIYDPGDSSTATFTATVPSVRFSSLNMKAGVVGVTTNFYTLGGLAFSGPYWYHSFQDAGNTYNSGTYASFTHNLHNTMYTFNFGHPIYGYDQINMNVSDASGVFSFSASMNANSIWCIVGDDYCESYGLPGQQDTILVKHGTTPAQIKGPFSWGSGYFGGELVSGSGQVVMISPGDKISATGAAPFTIPGPLTANVDTPTPSKTFSGLMPPNSYFYAYAYDSVYSNNTHWIGSDGAGNYTADFTGDSSGITFTSGDLALLDTSYTNPLTGNGFELKTIVVVP